MHSFRDINLYNLSHSIIIYTKLTVRKRKRERKKEKEKQYTRKRGKGYRTSPESRGEVGVNLGLREKCMREAVGSAPLRGAPHLLN